MAAMEHLEGRQSVLAALRARRRRFELVLLSHGAHGESIQELLDAAAELSVPIRRADRSELDAMCHGATHGGVVAVCTPRPPTPAMELFELLDRLAEPPLLLLLEGVDDERNLGFTLRTAEATGAHAVLIKKHLWDFDAVEIARPASGAFERLPIVLVDDVGLLRKLQRRGLALYGCLAGVKRTIYDVNLAAGCILAIGGEKRGLSGAVREICDGFVTIPATRGASSLPLAHAAAIVLAEAMRQRRDASGADF